MALKERLSQESPKQSAGKAGEQDRRCRRSSNEHTRSRPSEAAGPAAHRNADANRDYQKPSESFLAWHLKILAHSPQRKQ